MSASQNQSEETPSDFIFQKTELLSQALKIQLACAVTHVKVLPVHACLISYSDYPQISQICPDN